ncbi:TPA: hypothetical protein MYQ54_004516 [Escherichia coli]|nr:hypothetical protein [Alicycliphilus sp.]HCB1922802.1 hypothetical protein [Escherichia coli]HCB1928533.1 hypothetical protein [Escherichia coli]
MYKSADAFVAESHGLAVGKAHGLRQGYDEGWNAAIAHVQPQFDAAQREQRELAYALNALSVIAYSALAALKAAPEQHRLMATDIYAQEVNRLMKAGPKAPGAIRAVPHTDPALLARESDIAHLMQQWFEHSLALAKQQQRHHEDDSPSP